MAVNKGGVALWAACIRSHSSCQKRSWNLSQVLDVPWLCQARPLSSAAWALAPPNSLRYQSVRHPVLSHPLHHGSVPQRNSGLEEDWQDSVRMCVLVRRSECNGLHTLLELRLADEDKPGELTKPLDLSFPLTTVDGRREDDISVETFKRHSADVSRREHGCFRSLFEAERCPAPYIYGSTFYCYHCPGTDLTPCSTLKSSPLPGLNQKSAEVTLLPTPSLQCTQAGSAEEQPVGDSEGEEKLTMMYERLRIELPGFFVSNHDYSMYANDVEFINGLLNVSTRGRVPYQLSLSLWRLLCLLYYAEARLDVLKLTKHVEDGTVKARWRIKGLPFHSVLLRFYRKDKSHLYRSYDAFSTFYMGQDGLIHCHKVEKVMPTQPPVLPRITSLLAGVLVALGVQEHRPALNLLPLLLSSLRQSRN